jgi:hypothetical protein
MQNVKRFAGLEFTVEHFRFGILKHVKVWTEEVRR